MWATLEKADQTRVMWPVVTGIPSGGQCALQNVHGDPHSENYSDDDSTHVCTVLTGCSPLKHVC